MLLIGSDQADTRTSVRHGGVGEAPWLRRRHAPGFHIYRYRPGKLALPGRRLRAHMMHALHAVIGAHLHHVAVAIGHLRMVGHPDTLPRRTGRARPELRNLAPFIMATGRRSVRLRESWSRAEAKQIGRAQI